MGCPSRYYKRALQCFSHALIYNEDSKLKKMRKFLLIVSILLTGCSITPSDISKEEKNLETLINEIPDSIKEEWEVDILADSVSVPDGDIYTWNGSEMIPAYTGKAWTELNKNTPFFTNNEKITESFEEYTDLDSLGRCGQAYANVCKEIMPTQERGKIGEVKPTGWHTIKYPDIISDLYLYNRCHLIGYQLAGENANKKNLVTGTRYFNVEGMLPFENEVRDYVERTNNHVLYRVSPIFYEDELVCRGVEIEAYSVEDNGTGIQFHVFVYNVQPGITIDYTTGESWETASPANSQYQTKNYVLNVNSGKFHLPECESVKKIKEKNKQYYFCTRDELIEDGYSPCSVCNP